MTTIHCRTIQNTLLVEHIVNALDIVAATRKQRTFWPQPHDPLIPLPTHQVSHTVLVQFQIVSSTTLYPPYHYISAGWQNLPAFRREQKWQ